MATGRKVGPTFQKVLVQKLFILPQVNFFSEHIAGQICVWGRADTAENIVWLDSTLKTIPDDSQLFS